MFLEVLSPARLMPLLRQVEEDLSATAGQWSVQPEVGLHDELVRAYGRAVLQWAGVSCSRSEADRVSARLAAIVDGFGFAGTAYVKAWAARSWADRWAARLVRDARAGRRAVPPQTPLSVLSASPLDDRTAGVELLNLLRPTVAVAWLGAFAGLRLAEHPEWCERLAGDSAARFAFAQEVRRTTPFVPALTGRVRESAEVCGVTVQPGDRMLLDVVGIDQDPQRWPDPERFDPERFLGALPGAFDLVPQGGGHPSGHRCPGESLTLCLLDVTLGVLARTPARIGPHRVDRSRIPTLPTAGVRVRPRHRSGDEVPVGA
jgi:fatty-acid peroxygenase